MLILSIRHTSILLKKLQVLLLDKKEQSIDNVNTLFIILVPLTGFEPVRMLLRGILNPLRLPIPPQRRIYNARKKIYKMREKNIADFPTPCEKKCEKNLIKSSKSQQNARKNLKNRSFQGVNRGKSASHAQGFKSLASAYSTTRANKF